MSKRDIETDRTWFRGNICKECLEWLSYPNYEEWIWIPNASPSLCKYGMSFADTAQITKNTKTHLDYFVWIVWCNDSSNVWKPRYIASGSLDIGSLGPWTGQCVPPTRDLARIGRGMNTLNITLHCSAMRTPAFFGGTHFLPRSWVLMKKIQLYDISNQPCVHLWIYFVLSCYVPGVALAITNAWIQS